MKTLWIALVCALFALPRSARAACEEPAQVAMLREAEQLAEEAFARFDAELLLTQASFARAMLPCVQEVLTRQDAAAFHRLMALEAFFNRNYTRAEQELHASRMLEPGYEFPAQMVSSGHKLLELYESAQTLQGGEGEKIYPPPGGWILVGGVSNAARFSLTPVILQVFSADGLLRETRYVQPGESTPNWSGNAFGLTAADIGIDLDALSRPRLPTDPRPWFVAAVASAVAGGVLYGVAMQQKTQFQDPSTPDDDLQGLQSRANGLGAAGLAAGGTALVCTGFGLGFQVKFGAPPASRKQLAPTQEGP